MESVLSLAGPLSPRDGWRADDCSIASSLQLLSTRSSFLLLREAFYGATRFEEFTNRTGLSEPSVAARLRDLVSHGVLAHRTYQEPGQRTRRAYVLTEMGVDLFPVLAALMAWGDRWTSDDGGPVGLRHVGCGAAVTVELRCVREHLIAAPGEIELVARQARHGRRG